LFGEVDILKDFGFDEASRHNGDG